MSVYKAMVNELLEDQKENTEKLSAMHNEARLQAERQHEAHYGHLRGGARPGAGRKPMKPGLKKQKKAFSLSPESVQALADLQRSLGLPSQSAVVEFLALKAHREFKDDNRTIIERQEELF